jgi:hypothetical protein
MAFTEEDKHVIKFLRETKRYSARKFLKKFPDKNWTRRGLDELIKKMDAHGSINRRSGSGRLRRARTDDEIDDVAQLISSQDDQPQTHRTPQQIARETGLSRTSVRRIIAEDLQLKCLKRSKAQS